MNSSSETSSQTDSLFLRLLLAMASCNVLDHESKYIVHFIFLGVPDHLSGSHGPSDFEMVFSSLNSTSIDVLSSDSLWVGLSSGILHQAGLPSEVKKASAGS